MTPMLRLRCEQGHTYTAGDPADAVILQLWRDAHMPHRLTEPRQEAPSTSQTPGWAESQFQAVLGTASAIRGAVK